MRARNLDQRFFGQTATLSISLMVYTGFLHCGTCSIPLVSLLPCFMDVLLAGMYHTIGYDRHSLSGSPVVNAAGTRIGIYFSSPSPSPRTLRRGKGGVISPALTVDFA